MLDSLPGDPPNRVRDAIQHMEPIVKKLTIAQIQEVDKAFDIDFKEHFYFQEVKSLALLHEAITFDEAMLLYAMLGNSPDIFNAQPLHVKIAVTGAMKGIIKLRIEGKI